MATHDSKTDADAAMAATIDSGSHPNADTVVGGNSELDLKAAAADKTT